MASNSPSPIASNPPTPLALVLGPAGRERAAAVEAILTRHRQARPAAVLVEGFCGDRSASDDISWHALALGCPCCSGALPLFVTLARVVRQKRPKLVIVAAGQEAHARRLAELIAERFPGIFAVAGAPT